MKILMTTMSLNIGGAETHILELCRELRRRGHTVLVASAGGVYEAELAACGVRHYRVPLDTPSPGAMLRSLRLLRGILRRERPEIVHSHARIPAFLVGRLRGACPFRHVTTCHGVYTTQGLKGKLTDWGDRSLAVSEDIRDYLMENYAVPAEHIRLTVNGIDGTRFRPDLDREAVRREFAVRPGAPVVVHVSRMDDDSVVGTRQLVEAAEGAARALPGLTILAVGGGAHWESLNAQATAINKRLGYPCLHFTGPRTDVPQLLAAADLFVGVSRAALEAMSMEKPVILTGNGGYAGLFTPEKREAAIAVNFTNRNCPPMKPRELEKDIISFFFRPDRQKAALGKLGGETVRSLYSVARMGDDALAAYHAALAQRRYTLCGYYGFGNAGDEAILQAVRDCVTRVWPEAAITVLSAQTGKPEAVNRFSPGAVFAALRRSEVFVFGGGSLLQDATSSRSLWYYTTLLALARRLGNRVILLANGIGPVTRPRNKKRVAKAVQRADVVTLRDADSLRELRALGVERQDMALVPDPVFSLTPLPPTEAPPSASFLALCPRPWRETPELEAELGKLLDGLAPLGRRVVLIPMQPEKDTPLCHRLAAGRDGVQVLGSALPPRELMGYLEKAELVIAMRLHALIFAAATATPAVGISYDPKLDAILAQLDAPNIGSVAGFSGEKAAEAVAQALDDLPALREKAESHRANLAAGLVALDRALE